METTTAGGDAARRVEVKLLVSLQEGEQLVKKVGGVFAFNVKDGPGGETARWVVDVKSGQGSVTVDPGTWRLLLPSSTGSTSTGSHLGLSRQKRRTPSLSCLKRSGLTASPGWIEGFQGSDSRLPV